MYGQSEGRWKELKKKILIPVEMFIRVRQQQHGTQFPHISSVFILFGEFSRMAEKIRT